MKTERAKRLFSSLMKLARMRDLSTRESRLLVEARQMLRRRARPAMNPRKLLKCPKCGLELNAYQMAFHEAWHKKQEAGAGGLFDGATVLVFPEGVTAPKLGLSAKEAATIAARGRRPELLKESKEFDESRLVASPLFAGRGGRQKLLGNPPRVLRVENYQFKTPAGRPIRIATRVIYSNGQRVEFTEKTSKKEAIRQANDLIRRGYRANRTPNLSQAVDARLQEMRDLFRSGVTEQTGRLRYRGGYGPGDRDVIGRVGGVKPGFQELKHEPASPQAIAAAIGKRKGRVYDRVRDAVERDLSRFYQQAKKRSRGRLAIAPHRPVRRYCVHCRSRHTTGEHRFHGAGSFHKTHLFSFNPPGGRRVGRIVEIRYERDFGRRPGFYKHVFKVPASMYRMPDGSIAIG